MRIAIILVVSALPLVVTWRCATADTLTSLVGNRLVRSRHESAPQDSIPASCPITVPSQDSFESPASLKGPLANIQPAADQFWFGSEKLWTILPADGTWHGQASREAHRFVYSNKMPWFRIQPAFSTKDDPLTIQGRRLDGAAPRFTETYVNNGFGRDEDRSMIMGGMEIPTFGCWQITGRYKDRALTFVVWVTSTVTLDDAAPAQTIEDASSSVVRPSMRIRLRPDILALELVYSVEPETPAGVSGADAVGTVVLHALIGTEGKPHNLEFVSGPRALADAAIEATYWSQYRVTFLNDQPVEVDSTINIVFPPPSR